MYEQGNCLNPVRPAAVVDTGVRGSLDSTNREFSYYELNYTEASLRKELKKKCSAEYE